MAETTVNNGVNVGALLAAREVFKGAPQAAKFTWRASCKWKNGTHSVSKVEGFHGLGPSRSTRPSSPSKPIIRKYSLRRISAPRQSSSCSSASRAAYRRRRRGCAESRHPAAIGRSQARGIDGHPGHSRHRQRREKRLRRHQGDLQYRRRRIQEGHRSAGCAVAKTVGRVRHVTNPTNVRVEVV